MYISIFNSYYILFLIHTNFANKLNTSLRIGKVQLSFRFCIDVLLRCILCMHHANKPPSYHGMIQSGVIFLITAPIHRSGKINGLFRSPRICIYERVFARTLKRESVRGYFLSCELTCELSSCGLWMMRHWRDAVRW